MRVVYIGGCMRSGTTLLCQLIAAHSDALDVGELFGFWSHAARGSLCSCLVPIPECVLWSEALKATGVPRSDYAAIADILENHLRARYFLRLRRQIRTQTVPPSLLDAVMHTHDLAKAALQISGRSVLVDSSKEIPGLMLHIIAGAEPLDLVQIVRDPRAVAASHVRSLRAPVDDAVAAPPGTSWGRSVLRWYISNFAFWAGASGLDRAVRRISYEDLVASAARAVPELVRELDLPERIAGSAMTRSHLPVGNPSRLAFDGQVTIDDRWRDELTPAQKHMIRLVASPAQYLLRPNIRV